MRVRSIILALFLVIPIAEVGAFIWVGNRIGVGPTLLAVVATALLGGWLVSRQGRGVASEARDVIAQGSFPGTQLAHGAMILVAGALLITPGFVTDVIGFLLLVPGIREAVRRRAARRMRPAGIIDV